jgi:ubiquinone/menaquinone biosynthesis C-methylase UbiE
MDASAENIPVDNGFFDVVVSVNTIDHVDDFPSVAREIRRVIKLGGFLILEVHYHKPTKTEPWTLDDKACIRYFGDLGIKKIHDGPFIKFCASRERTERLVTTERQVIWSNYVHRLRLRNNLVMDA